MGECDSAPLHVHNTLLKACVLASAVCALQGSWAFRTKYWLPLQVLTVLLAVFGAYRHQVGASRHIY
jgi:hypothetical protein